jgi:hypothetical protein
MSPPFALSLTPTESCSVDSAGCKDCALVPGRTEARPEALRRSGERSAVIVKARLPDPLFSRALKVLSGSTGVLRHLRSAVAVSTRSYLPCLGK